jgi:hypothetical protein
MFNFSRISLAMLLVATPFVAGCTTTSGKTDKNNVTINKGAFQDAETAIGDDIQSLLAKGGVDPVTSGSQTMTAQNSGPEILSTTATDLQTLVAQLDAAPPKASTNGQKSLTPAQTTATASTTALALAETPKPTPAQKIIENTQTTTFEPIGTPGELVPIMPPIVEEIKPVQTATAPTKRATNKTKRKAPEVATSYKKPSVKRF